ncbi:MAG: hypothetical protein ABIN58_08350, partial [candidate division WOR-3 bacterium]
AQKEPRGAYPINKSGKITVSQEQLQHASEPLIRRAIREELSRVIQQEFGVFYLRPEKPLYEDQVDIAPKRATGTIELFSHQGVWNE